MGGAVSREELEKRLKDQEKRNKKLLEEEKEKLKEQNEKRLEEESKKWAESFAENRKLWEISREKEKQEQEKRRNEDKYEWTNSLQEERNQREKSMKTEREAREESIASATEGIFAKFTEEQRKDRLAFEQILGMMITSAPLSAPEKDCYPMDIKKKPIGRCLIINNENFKEHYSPRYGTQLDMQRLKDLFEQFGFEIKEKNDATKDQMEEALKDQSELEPAKDMDCCIVIILSHGSHEGIVGTDGRCLELHDIWYPFTIDGSRWKGKPKVFVVQTSQENQGVESEEQQHLNSAIHDQFRHEALNDPDIFLWCATGTSSTPASKSGSIYIKTFVNTLNEYYREHDLDSMMTLVKRRVAKIGSSQQPYNTNTLLKKLYFDKQ